MNATETAEQIRREAFGKIFTCSRCRSRVDGIHNEDHESVLTTLGWHRAGDVRFCSKGCLEWHQVLAGRGEAPKAVEHLADHAYQARRAALNIPASAPPFTAPLSKPPAKR